MLETVTLTVILTHNFLFHEQFLGGIILLFSISCLLAPFLASNKQSGTKLSRQLIELCDMFPLSEQRDRSSCKNKTAFTPVRMRYYHVR